MWTICIAAAFLILVGICIGVHSERCHPCSPSNTAKRKAEEESEEYRKLNEEDRFGKY